MYFSSRHPSIRSAHGSGTVQMWREVHPEVLLRVSAIVAALVGALLAGGGTWVFPACAAGFEAIRQRGTSAALLATPVLFSSIPEASVILLWSSTSILVALASVVEESQWPGRQSSQEKRSLLAAMDTRTQLGMISGVESSG